MNLAPMPTGSRPDRTPPARFPTASGNSGSERETLMAGVQPCAEGPLFDDCVFARRRLRRLCGPRAGPLLGAPFRPLRQRVGLGAAGVGAAQLHAKRKPAFRDSRAGAPARIRALP